MTADLALLAGDPNRLEQYADPGEFIIAACTRAKEWLGQALNSSHIEEIVEVKSQAEAIRVYTAQKQIGHDAELAAAEVVRRAERGIGVAVRKGQEAGEIRKHGERGPVREPHERIRHGRTEVVQPERVDETTSLKRGATDFLSHGELTRGAYPLADGVSDEAFEAALAEAKAEANLSRTNVVRKVKGQGGVLSREARANKIRELAEQGHTSRQMASKIGVTFETVRLIARDFAIEIPADKLTHKNRLIDSTRVARQTVFALEGAATGLDLINYDDIDRAEIADWATSLTESLRELNRFAKQIKEMAQ